MAAELAQQTMTDASAQDLRAPMASAPMAYNEDGSVAWDQMWDTFCVLASVGGPPHRDTVLRAPTEVDTTTPAYQRACEEIIRGVWLVSGLRAVPSKPGWIAITCDHAAHARWLGEQIVQENVEAYAEESCCFVPVDSHFTTDKEIKNVITVVAKTTHYWRDHLASEIRTSLVWEERLRALRDRITGWWR